MDLLKLLQKVSDDEVDLTTVKMLAKERVGVELIYPVLKFILDLVKGRVVELEEVLEVVR